MSSDTEFENIVKGLYHKTRIEKVDWKQGSNKDRFWLTLPESSIGIEFEGSSTVPDRIHVVVFSADEEIARWTVEEGEVQWQSAADLYWLVRRQASGWDRVLADIHKFIGATEKTSR